LNALHELFLEAAGRPETPVAAPATAQAGRRA
jgi:hypothetical protein